MWLLLALDLHFYRVRQLFCFVSIGFCFNRFALNEFVCVCYVGF